MGLFTNILISAVTVLVSAFSIYNYMPLRWLDTFPSEKKLGATITNIAGTDTIKDSRSTINTNFSNLNTGKIEVGTTSVASITTLGGLTTASALNAVGTITVGSWTGNTIQSANGGTGTTSMSQYRVLLGNGTASTTIATSTGTAGQYFISNGEGANPSWQTKSTDTSTNYTWTGNHTFNGATTTLKTTTGTTTVIIDTRAGSTDSALNFTENGNNDIGVGFQLDGSDNSLYIRDLNDNVILGVFDRDTNRFGVGTTTPGATISAAGDIYSSTGFRTPIGTLFAGFATGATSTAKGITFNMVISHGLGVVPSFIKVTTQTIVDASATALQGSYSIGTAASTASQYTIGMANGGNGAVATVADSTGMGSIIYIVNDAGVAKMVGALTSITSTTFTIAITTNTGAANDRQRNIIWEAY